MILSFSFRNWDRAPKGVRAGVAQLPGIIQARLTAGVQGAIREIAVRELADVTPVRTGNLQRSTTGVLIIENGRVTLDLDQPAENPSGQQYVEPLVRGHYTQAGTLVPPNPYPQEAMASIRPLVNQVAHEIAQQIAQDTIYVLGSG